MLKSPASEIWAIEGEIVSCFFCKAEIYKLRQDLIYGLSPVSASKFEPLGESPPLIDGTPNPCPNCGAEWFKDWHGALNRGEFCAVKRLTPTK